ncbi:MAG: hypothetical protein ACRD0U_09120, partial [Acidimicrobiales bacterium]
CSKSVQHECWRARRWQELTAGDPVGAGVVLLRRGRPQRRNLSARQSQGACRHLVKAHMDLTGARCGIDGAEAVLKPRALRGNGDFDEYLAFHLAQEHRRVHQSRCANGLIPVAA